VIRATEDQNYPVRRVATELLARRYGQSNSDIVLPVLRRLTHDPAVEAKATAAYWVAKFGDASGHEELKPEYVQRVPGGSDQQRCGEEGKYQV